MPEASSSPQCAAFWTHCLSCLEQELPAQQFKTWILPLRAEDLQGEDAAGLRLVAPSNFHRQWLRDRYLRRIEELSEEYFGGMPTIEVTLAPAGGLRRPGTSTTAAAAPAASAPAAAAPTAGNQPAPISNHVPAAMNTGRQIAAEASVSAEVANYDKSRLNPDFTFDTLVTGRANDLARAAALQVAQNPGVSYNPLFIYGGVGLGKTHLIHALGNTVFKANPRAVIRYVHAEDYYADVVRAYQQKSFDVFKRYYRSLDVLIIDDIQFFNNKNRTQEEFFHAFNALTEAKKQIIITSDTYPKDVQGLEDRLISRFDWGLTVQIEPPELEMRVAILKKKAEVERIALNEDVAFLIAKNLRSNVRELEGALKKVLAFARFHGKEVTLEVAKEALKDLLNAHNRQLTAEFIQKTVADYYKIKIADMHSKKRTRVIARPRQVAMFLAKDLTPMSLPAIGEAFGGRDHTTVLHACRTIAELRLGDTQLNHDLHVLTQVLRG
ncbi:MAG: chromosomal replication initiator protein DnaA [Zoogloea oleivorans]|uniref:Chromosomal replication initiator protein DnaA n=1 Tax=Zoogloea oleivorans TaxID=1552750 RepID=A0A6C2CYN9_9RHOO|nr:chromosomal replication initiator protein DnaA [Zoogloea oleivorans]MBT9496453.1 chromosomal replication initiator protein DnaA [Zoogloea sp.]MDY0037587.1 chromosomal replication initiator protein DnaA [Zoogloea oleivorans]TYC58452.1 chromosomal replication initiator protein DnaA [Zoogloea oleivorans]